MSSKRSAKECSELHQGFRFSRRAALEAGWLGAMSFGLPALWHGQSQATESGQPGFGKAKRCLLMFMWGGPSHLDTWDPKPEAPAEIRGEFQAISTATPGIFISEHFPKLAAMTSKLAIVRSVTHDDPAHLSSAHHILTGHHAPKRFSDDDPPSVNDWPHIGSVIARLRPAEGATPSFVAMPWTVMHPGAPGGKAPGQHGGWLGAKFDPMNVSDPNAADFHPPGLALPPDVDGIRLGRRRSLLNQLDDPWFSRVVNPVLQTSHDLTERALNLLSAPQVRIAFEMSNEPPAVRDRYGRNTHGQSLLLARRLLESGVPLVTVNWHNDSNPFWDTHGDNFNKLKGNLMPIADQGFSALLEDLESRGLLEDTLLVWVGEFGRKPQITAANAGREHWPFCFSAVFAGGGVRGGQVYGSSDRIGAYPAESAVQPDDIAATIFHALGVPTITEIYDRQQVPRRISHGEPITAIFT